MKLNGKLIDKLKKLEHPKYHYYSPSKYNNKSLNLRLTSLNCKDNIYDECPDDVLLDMKNQLISFGITYINNDILSYNEKKSLAEELKLINTELNKRVEINKKK